MIQSSVERKYLDRDVRELYSPSTGIVLGFNDIVQTVVNDVGGESDAVTWYSLDRSSIGSRPDFALHHSPCMSFNITNAEL